MVLLNHRAPCAITRPTTMADLAPAPREVVALVPAYNEERFIGSIVLALRSYVDEVIVVDDGSSDRTAEIARRAGATLIQHTVNQGKAAAVNTGFSYLRRVSASAVVMLDGDGQHRAQDVPHVVAPILADQADIVVGSRFLGDQHDIPAHRRLGQHGLNLVTNLASGLALSDTQSGFRAFSRAAIERLCFCQGGFSVESEMQFRAEEHRLRVQEVPISVSYADPAKRHPLPHALQVIQAVLRLVGRVRPLLSFSLVGLPLLLAGLAFGLVMLQRSGQAGELAVGYALLTLFAVALGLALIVAGIVLHSVRGMFLDLERRIASGERQ